MGEREKQYAEREKRNKWLNREEVVGREEHDEVF